MKVIRWLGAYTQNWNPDESLNLRDKLRKELERYRVREREVSAEALPKGEQSQSYFNLPVGLLVARGAVRRVYIGDVYSYARKNGKLKGKFPTCSDGAKESFCRPYYSHIVVRPDLLRVGGKRWKIIFEFSREYNLPVLDFYTWKPIHEEDYL